MNSFFSGRICAPIYTDMHLQLKKFISASYFSLFFFFFLPSDNLIFYVIWPRGVPLSAYAHGMVQEGKYLDIKYLFVSKTWRNYFFCLFCWPYLKKRVVQELLKSRVTYTVCIIPNALWAISYLVLNPHDYAENRPHTTFLNTRPRNTKLW